MSFSTTELLEVSLTSLTANITPKERYRHRWLKPSFTLTIVGTLGRACGAMSVTLLSNDNASVISMITKVIIIVCTFLLIAASIMYKSLTSHTEQNKV